MTQEDKELLLKDICARIPYGVICHANEINIDGELIFVNKLYNIAALYYDNAIGKFESCPIDDTKPYLRPISSMTEEEVAEFESITDELLEHGTSEEIWNTVIDWLNARHFDHRHLIEKNLALEAPEGMYKLSM